MLQAILVAEDDESLRDVIAWSLRAEGYRVVTASDGVEALRVLAAGQVELALLDLRMPRMNGQQVIARMRPNPEMLRIPVVVLTGFPAEAPTELAVLPKPFSGPKLLETVRAIIGQGSPRSAAARHALNREDLS
jgi:CheY-like chemotaxis protein